MHVPELPTLFQQPQFNSLYFPKDIQVVMKSELQASKDPFQKQVNYEQKSNM